MTDRRSIMIQAVRPVRNSSGRPKPVSLVTGWVRVVAALRQPDAESAWHGCGRRKRSFHTVLAGRTPSVPRRAKNPDVSNTVGAKLAPSATSWRLRMKSNSRVS